MNTKPAEYGMTASMSRKDNCGDNAPTERLFNSLKNVRVHGTAYATCAHAQADPSHPNRPRSLAPRMRHGRGSPHP